MFHEATAAAGKLGAQEIIEWYRAHPDRVRVEPTLIFGDAMKRATQPGFRLARDTGERASLEVVRASQFLKPMATARFC